MNIEAMNGIIDAIEQEAFQPSPSHSNLARLIVKAFREVVSGIPEVMAKQSETKTETINAVGATLDLPAPESKPTKKKPRSKK